MNAPGFTAPLIFAALVCGAIAFLVMRRCLSTVAAATVAAVKVAVPALYFAHFNRDVWHIIDDVLYLNTATMVLTAGFNPLTVITNPIGRSMIMGAAAGIEVMYWWWNVLAEWIFGIHYFAPVFLNVIPVALTCVYVYRIARLCDFSHGYAQMVAIFSTLHWDVVAWTSFLNIKDPLALLFTTASLAYLLELQQRVRVRTIVKLAIAFALLTTIRFYMPVLVLAAFALFLLGRRVKLKLLVPIGLAGLGILFLLRNYLVHLDLVDTSVIRWIYGVVRFAVTPQPWSIEPNYTFLTIPAILHWLFFPAAVAGLWLCWRRYPAMRFLLLYLAVVTAFYGAVPELQGPRYRMQVSFIWAWMEFHFIYVILTPVSSNFMTRRVAVASPS